MAKWDDGYVTDVAYTSNYYREITPAWLAMTSLLLGHRPPDLAEPFHYADLGCGNGFTTLSVAASSPHADVWGFDFNPAHVEFAARVGRPCRPDQCAFRRDIICRPGCAARRQLPDFDFMVSHGVLSWISPANQHQLMSVIARRLKPGGLVYLGYNVTTGWTAMVPVRVLMRMLAEANPERSDLAVPAVLDYIDRLKQGRALFFQANPSIETRLQDIRKQDQRYIAHEYLNRDWHPLMFADVAAEMAEAKCCFIGSAALAENIDTVAVPANVAPILAETRDPYLRETLRDLGCAQTFRRDVYRKGIAPLPLAEQQLLMEAVLLAGLGVPAPEGGPTFASPIGNVTGRPEIYQPLLAMLDEGPVSVRTARSLARLRRASAGGTDAGLHLAGFRRLRPSDASRRRDRGRARGWAPPEPGDCTGERQCRRTAPAGGACYRLGGGRGRAGNFGRRRTIGRPAGGCRAARDRGPENPRPQRPERAEGRHAGDRSGPVAPDRRRCHPQHDRETVSDLATTGRAGGGASWRQTRCRRELMTRAQTAADTTLLAALVLALLIRTQTVQLRLHRLEFCCQRRFLGIGDGEHIEAVRRQAEFW